jgi:MFS family permease
MEKEINKPQKNSVRNLNKIVIILGLVSFFTDISSEMIVPLIPIFLTLEFGATPTIVGLIEGVAEATANVMKGFSGLLSDKVKRKRNLIALGYGLSSFSKPIIALATGPFIVLGARFGDRIGKGIRTSPRDHLLSNATTSENRGIAFGFHRAMDTSGALLGSLIALITLVLLFSVPNIFRILFIISFIPAIIGVFFIFLIKEEKTDKKETKTNITSKNYLKLSKKFYYFLFVAISIYFVQISLSFLVLRSQSIFTINRPIWWNYNFGEYSGTILTLVCYVLFNIFYASSSTYLGKLSDKYGRIKILQFGIILLAIILLLFAFSDEIKLPELVIVAMILLGFYMASTEGVAKAMIADITPKEIRGRGYGIFNLSIGITALVSAVTFGMTWETFGPDFAFISFAILCIVPIIGLILFSRMKNIAINE